jgi:hypothetical protein
MAPCGPCVVPAQFIEDTNGLRILLYVNDRKMMDASADQILYKVGRDPERNQRLYHDRTRRHGHDWLAVRFGRRARQLLAEAWRQDSCGVGARRTNVCMCDD